MRSLLVYGYVLDPPTGDVEAAEVKASLHPTHRTYRAEKTYGVSSGKWYYEVEILSPGSVSLGWALTDAAPDAALGRIYVSYTRTTKSKLDFFRTFFSFHFDPVNDSPASADVNVDLLYKCACFFKKDKLWLTVNRKDPYTVNVF